MKTYQSYAELKKPSFAPPAWLFGPVWTFLYVLIAISFGYVLYHYFAGSIPFVVALPFVINLIVNAAFTPIQFRLKSNALAALDILLVLGSLAWAMIAVFPLASWVTFLNIPYLLWVSFATVLQLTVTYLNRKK